MKVSVVIPAYNEEKYIEDCLAAIEEQKDSKVEIIVVDNKSTDCTGEIAERYADKVVREDKKGVAIARQRGFLEATGEIVAYTDADTVVAEDWIENIRESFNGKTIAVYGPVYLLDGYAIEEAASKYAFTYFLQLNHLIGLPNISGQNFAVKREVIKKVGGFNTKLKSAEDVELGRRIKKIGELEFNSKLRVYTSARRLRAGHQKFLTHHTLNYLSLLLLGKTRDFEDVRL